MKRMRPGRIAGIAVGAVVLSVLAAMPLACSKKADDPSRAAGEAKPVPVLAAAVVKQAVEENISTFGTVQANASTTIRAQVTGMLNKVCFRKGQDIKKGQLLFEIDRGPFEAALKQMEANKARDDATLANAQKELKRQADLLEKGIASTADFDKAQTDAAAAAAAVKADEAAIENSKLQLGFCTIFAALDGRAGDLLVDAGNLVKANDVALVTINQVQPIQVYFSVPQRDLQSVLKYMAEGALKVTVKLPGDGQAVEEGELTFVDNNVDTATHTAKLGATFANEHSRLWPGLYVDVTLRLTERQNAIVVPTQAVQSGRDGRYVFVIATDAKGEKIAEIRTVTIGRAVDGKTIIESGLEGGEQIVTDGQVRLLPGAKVLIRTSLEQAASMASRPSQRS